MSSNLSMQSHRPSPPESPPVDFKQPPAMNVHLPHTPQSPLLAPAASLPTSAIYNMDKTEPSSAISLEDVRTATFDESSTNPIEVSNKRKREAGDDGGQEQKKVHIENGTPDIEALHRDVGPPYRLASAPYPKALVDLTVDLFKVYSLEDIAKDVARGGENPKKMGKTYKKHMRLMKLSGKFDAVKKRDDEVGLFDMLQMPDEEWDQSQTLGKNLQNGLGAAARSNLAQAMTMSKGRIPKDRWDPSVLALAEPVAPTAAAAKSASVTGTNQKIPLQRPNVAANQSRLPKTAAEQARPQRNIKKRTYTDDGFEGYGEGYADDVTDDGGFRSGDEKRRKKDTSGYHFSPTMRHAGYGPGTVGA